MFPYVGYIYNKYMKIGIDISQLAYQGTGVSNYLENLVLEMVKDKNNEYILFFSSFRRNLSEKIISVSSNTNVVIKSFKYPPSFLSLLWNRLHVLPIENFIGDIDFFITSDWTEPPTRKAVKATIVYDLIVYKNPDETEKKIISTQKTKLFWVKKESKIIFCISESTKKDVGQILGVDEKKVKVIYPGIT